MKTSSPLLYFELFSEAPPKNYQSLIENIDSEMVIAFLANINNMLFRKFSQENILTSIFGQVPPAIDKFFRIRRQRILVFMEEHILHFIENEIIDFRDLNQKSLTQEKQMKIFKAYVMQVEKFSKDFVSKYPKLPNRNEDFSFQKATWHLMINQYSFVSEIDFTYKLLKSDLMIRKLRNDYNEYVINFLEYIKYESFEKYVHSVLFMLEECYRSGGFSFEIHNGEGLFTQMIINIRNFEKELFSKSDFIGLREKPILMKRNGALMILSWKFFEDKFDVAFVIDFYKNSGINLIFSSLPKFKQSFYSEYVLEKNLFKRTLQYIFQAKVITYFDDATNSGMPDAYIRSGNDIFIFEFKDAWMPSSVITEPNFENLYNDIEEKYVSNSFGKPKGIGQLLKHTLKIKNGGFSFDILTKEQIEKCKIYPIIVFTHNLYSMPGINSLLVSKQKELTGSNHSLNIGMKVYPVTMISMSFLIRYHLYIKFETLKYLIKNYHEKIKDWKKKAVKNSQTAKDEQLYYNQFFTSNYSFDDVYRQTASDFIKKKATQKEYIKFTDFILANL